MGFAEVRSAEWRTREAGEDALTQRFDGRGNAAAAAELAAGASSLRGITSVIIELDLCLVATDGTRVPLPRGADLVLEWEEDLRLEATLGLNTDIFVARTWADNRD